ncbi:MAG: hypothetical protein WC713_11960 [Candidatus Methylomirabilota bacterium]
MRGRTEAWLAMQYVMARSHNTLAGTLRQDEQNPLTIVASCTKHPDRVDRDQLRASADALDKELAEAAHEIAWLVDPFQELRDRVERREEYQVGLDRRVLALEGIDADLEVENLWKACHNLEDRADRLEAAQPRAVEAVQVEKLDPAILEFAKALSRVIARS